MNLLRSFFQAKADLLFMDSKSTEGLYLYLFLDGDISFKNAFMLTHIEPFFVFSDLSYKSSQNSSASFLSYFNPL